MDPNQPHPNVVYLRPQPAAAPVDYIREQEKAGMVVMPLRNLAIYTSKTGANAGPKGDKGDPGEDQNSWFDTIIASCSDEFSPIDVSIISKTTFRAPYPLDLTSGYIRASLTTAPEGSAMIIDVHMNGVSMFSTPISIDDGSRTSVGSAVPAVLAITAVPDDAEFTVFVTQIGATVAGTGLKVAVTGIKTS